MAELEKGWPYTRHHRKVFLEAEKHPEWFLDWRKPQLEADLARLELMMDSMLREGDLS